MLKFLVVFIFIFSCSPAPAPTRDVINTPSTNTQTTSSNSSSTDSGSTGAEATETGSITPVVTTVIVGSQEGSSSNSDEDEDEDEDDDSENLSHTTGQGTEAIIIPTSGNSEVITLTNASGSEPAEAIHNGLSFSVTNPQEETCYYRISKNDQVYKITKVTRSSSTKELKFQRGCDSPSLNFCSEKYLRVEVFSSPSTVCDVGLELSQEDQSYFLSRTNPGNGSLYLASCANESKCFTNSSLTLFRKTQNKFEFTIQRNSGLSNSKLKFSNIKATEVNGFYKNHYLSRMIAPQP